MPNQYRAIPVKYWPIAAQIVLNLQLNGEMKVARGTPQDITEEYDKWLKLEEAKENG
jgi:hypothetical protein